MGALIGFDEAAGGLQEAPFLILPRLGGTGMGGGGTIPIPSGGPSGVLRVFYYRDHPVIFREVEVSKEEEVVPGSEVFANVVKKGVPLGLCHFTVAGGGVDIGDRETLCT